MEPFLTLWLGKELVDKTVIVGLIILFGVWANNMDFIPKFCLEGQRIPGMVALIHAFELLQFLIILWVMAKLWGGTFAWLISGALDAVLLSHFSNLLKNNSSKLYYSTLVNMESFLFVYF